MLDFFNFVAALFAGAVASVAGFGIGSLLTPILAMQIDIKLAVAIVTFPHFVATAIRFYMLRSHLRKSILFHFGILSVVGSVYGAAIHNTLSNPVLTVVFAGMLIFAGLSGLSGMNKKLHLGKRSAWIAGAMSGLFGGLVGNQGGIRSAALLAFDLSPQQFVATATAIALIVDVARMPVYMLSEGQQLAHSWPLIGLLTAGTVFGTAISSSALRMVPPAAFRTAVSCMILLLGITTLGSTMTQTSHQALQVAAPNNVVR